MKLLILGGTLFLGRHITEEALERGHAVTLFTRGKTHPELFPEVERITGDRKVDLSPLVGRRWRSSSSDLLRPARCPPPSCPRR